MNDSSEGSPITISAPSRERMMSSIPCLSSVPGAIRPTAVSSFESRRGSVWAGWRMRPSGGGIPAVLSSFGLFSIDRCSCGLSERLGFEYAYFATNAGLGLAGALRDDHAVYAELAALLQPALRLGRGPQAPREADLAEGRELRLQRRALCCGDDREGDREIRPRLVDAPPACDVHKQARWTKSHPGMPRENGHDHREPLGVDARADAARHREVGRRDERLDLEQKRPRPLERAGDGSPDLTVDAAAEELGGLRNADEARPGHLEDRQLVRRAEAVLGRPEHAVLVVAVALELQHAVDQVLEHTRAGDGAVLGHVADEEDRDAGFLRHAQQPRRSL